MATPWVPAKISKITEFEPQEVRAIELTLPSLIDLPTDDFDKGPWPVVDEMRPGTAFLAEPLGAITRKVEKRLYTRSNVSLLSPRILETIINNTHDNPNTSLWWQDKEIEVGDVIRVRVDYDGAQQAFKVYEHSIKQYEKSLWLEPDDFWIGQKLLGLAFSTGITPFLAYLRYMASLKFGANRNTHFVLVVSVRNPRQLMFHEELLELENKFPKNFKYHPVLTREWPEDWLYTRGRIILSQGEGKDKLVSLGKLFAIVPDLEERHVRMCGGKTALEELRAGLCQEGVITKTFRAETW